MQSGQTVWDIVQQRDRQCQLTAKAGRALDAFVAFIDQSRPRFRKASLAESARHLLEAIDYASELARAYPDPNERQARWAAVEELVNALATYEAGAREPTLRDSSTR